MHSNVVTTHGDGIVVNHHTLDHFVVCNKNIKMTSDITFAQLAILFLSLCCFLVNGFCQTRDEDVWREEEREVERN